MPRKCAYVTVEGVEGVKKNQNKDGGVFKDKPQQTDREICDAVLNQSPSRRGGKTEMMARFKSQCDQKPLCFVNLLLLFVCRFSEGAQVIIRSSIRVNAGWSFLHVSKKKKKTASKIHMLRAKPI